MTDEKLLDDYLKCKSVNNAIDKLIDVLKDVGIQDNKITEIKNKYILELIPAGTKGVIRGNKFNQIVKKYITNLKLDKKIYEIYFEKKCEDIETSEIPDWYIKNIKNNKVIIGMNQVSLWGLIFFIIFVNIFFIINFLIYIKKLIIIHNIIFIS